MIARGRAAACVLLALAGATMFPDPARAGATTSHSRWTLDGDGSRVRMWIPAAVARTFGGPAPGGTESSTQPTNPRSVDGQVAGWMAAEHVRSRVALSIDGVPCTWRDEAASSSAATNDPGTVDGLWLEMALRCPDGTVAALRHEAFFDRTLGHIHVARLVPPGGDPYAYERVFDSARRSWQVDLTRGPRTPLDQLGAGVRQWASMPIVLVAAVVAGLVAPRRRWLTGFGLVLVAGALLGATGRGAANLPWCGLALLVAAAAGFRSRPPVLAATIVAVTVASSIAGARPAGTSLPVTGAMGMLLLATVTAARRSNAVLAPWAVAVCLLVLGVGGGATVSGIDAPWVALAAPLATAVPALAATTKLGERLRAPASAAAAALGGAWAVAG